MASVKKDIRQLIKVAEKAGWVVGYDNSGHRSWIPPNGGVPVRTSSTPSDWRGLERIKNDLRRKGLDVPHAGYTPPKVTRADVDENLDPYAMVREAQGIHASVAGSILGQADPFQMHRVGAAADRLSNRNPIIDGIAFLGEGLLAWESGTSTESPTLEEVMASIGSTARVSGGVVTKIAQGAYEILRMEAERLRSPREGTRWLYQHSIKFAILRAARAAGITDAEELETYSKLIYGLFKDDSRGEPAALCLRGYKAPNGSTPAVESLWSLADAWTAPDSIVPLTRFKSERDKRMEYVEGKLTPEQAGENRQPAPVEIVQPATTANETKETAMSEEAVPMPNAPYKCAECGETFLNKSALGGHTHKHRNERLRALEVIDLDSRRPAEDTVTATGFDPSMVDAVRACMVSILTGDSKAVTDLTYERDVQAEQITQLVTDVKTMSEQIDNLRAALAMVNDVVNLKAIGLDADSLGLSL